MKRVFSLAVVLAAWCAWSVAPAAGSTLAVQGYLNDSANPHLVGADLGPPLFGDDFDIANNVALYDLLVPVTGVVTFNSVGFAAGGVDPYFTLFEGSGPGATFLDSNFAQAFSTGGDFVITRTLTAGAYQFAIGVFANMSFAENLGTGTLADGFIGLGEPDFLATSYYALNVTTPDATVPEPATFMLLLTGLGAAARRRRK